MENQKNLNDQIVMAAERMGSLAEFCQLVDNDPGVGAVTPYWRASPDLIRLVTDVLATSAAEPIGYVDPMTIINHQVECVRERGGPYARSDIWVDPSPGLVPVFGTARFNAAPKNWVQFGQLFKAAFDNPIARRKLASEEAVECRKIFKEIDASMSHADVPDFRLTPAEIDCAAKAIARIYARENGVDFDAAWEAKQKAFVKEAREVLMAAKSARRDVAGEAK